MLIVKTHTIQCYTFSERIYTVEFRRWSQKINESICTLSTKFPNNDEIVYSRNEKQLVSVISSIHPSFKRHEINIDRNYQYKSTQHELILVRYYNLIWVLKSSFLFNFHQFIKTNSPFSNNQSQRNIFRYIVNQNKQNTYSPLMQIRSNEMCFFLWPCTKQSKYVILFLSNLKFEQVPEINLITEEVKS